MKSSIAARGPSPLLAIACLGLAVVALTAPRPASATVFSNPAPITIGAGVGGPTSVYPSPIAVSGLSGMTTDVNVTLSNFSHAEPKDLSIALVPPAGQTILLFGEAGGNQDAVNQTITIDDAAPAFVPQNAAIPAGSYKPTSYFSFNEFPAPGPSFNYCNPGPSMPGPFCTLASALNGFNPNGTWNLFVHDFHDTDGGSIAGGWSLDISVPPPTTQTPTTDPSTSAPPSDTTAPETKLTKKPAKKGTARKVKFVFSSTEAGSSFQCKLDKGKFKSCTSPFQKAVSLSAHSFQVKAIDIAGNVDATPAKYDFRVVKPTS